MIREILVSDAEEFLALNKKIDDETNFMLFEKNERNYYRSLSKPIMIIIYI
ncbi:hypothetical protein [Bacillus methanolicus]|uniref:Uncharacterized protein n=1 Tax=Bacillus methanolicus (strain MGA3 / ATCC 53907) TaxID=796606 RepID=I3E8D4_BACMM|nr:hypothetical protein BMMGA3_08105 [Bacillus methanolicus MGA3]EIJ82755.1 hypothetical protein MGA3_05980 [Bacillus methanolicus MGA3]